ncbi:MAG: DUF3883 domain-containing protein [Actinomycetota bacterium]|nr:DUF3883 domain-containing protein [Actinomycetota bacterium]
MNDDVALGAFDGRVPTGYQLRAVLRAARSIGAGASPAQARAAYREVATGGMFYSADMIAAQALLVQTRLIAVADGYLSPSDRLLDLLALSEEVAIEMLLAVILEEIPPLWLGAAAGSGEFQEESIPDEQAAILADLMPDPDRREATLLALGRRHEAELLRALGDLGERCVVAACRLQLETLGRDDLAAEVRQVSLISDQLGYDVTAPALDGSSRRLEVKAVRGAGSIVRLFLSRNEARVGLSDPGWALVISRVTGDDQAAVVGWCRASSIEPLLPTDNADGGRWTSVELRLSVGDLHAGLPPPC